MNGAFITHNLLAKGSQGSARVRAKSLVPYWDGCEMYQVGKRYEDFLIFQKADWVQMLKVYDGLKIYDICDPIWLAGSNMDSLFMCDGAVCATPELEKDIKAMGYKNPTKVIDDCADPNWETPSFAVRPDKIKSAMWFGYSDTAYLLEEFIPVVEAWGIEFYIISDKPCDVPSSVFVSYTDSLVAHFASIVDVAILPDYSIDKHNLKLKYKTKNKTYQCNWWGLPVASSVEDLQRLDDPEARKVEAEAKQQLAFANYHPTKAVAQWLSFLQSLKAA